MELYKYKNGTLKFNIKYSPPDEKEVSENILKYVLTFKSPYESPSDINNSVYCELFLKKDFFIPYLEFLSIKDNNLNSVDFRFFNKEIPFLILLHGFSTRNEKLKHYYKFIYNILNQNIACIFINLPFHLNRKPPEEISGGRLIYYDDIETLLFFHQCVVDVRKCADIIENIFSPKEINICGVSLGSMVSVITMAVENKLKKGIFIVSGGNWEEIHWNGILRYVLKGNCAGNEMITREKCRKYYSNFPVFIKKVKSVNQNIFTTEVSDNPELNNLCTRKCYLCDPLTFAHKINPDNVLMINSRLDHYFSRKSTSSLWEELGKPEIHWYNYPHFSGIINRKEIFKTITEFLKKS